MSRSKGRSANGERNRAADQRARNRKAPVPEPSRYTDEERTAAEAAFEQLLARQRDTREGDAS